ncbi:AzlC family ABC transporter permease [Ruegeria sp. R13_0]|uniref:AzlC family ABC transporter permease n=1 Tax=Ruegeria sp. R13_0 TaxID=2821099 RepID=UPI001ADBDFC7|nr:AzlC family ABC transporter permease [Ruegeria sp. R13_0]MBO9437021.1 AzlC family ABC transporter permease [Ruegeria sp. R13_0]
MKRGAIAVLPLALAASFYGFAFGILAAQAGFTWWSVGVLSASVYAGSSQIVAVEQLSTTGSVIAAIIAGAALNLRYVAIVASLSEVLDGLSIKQKLLAIHLVSDENWALTMAQRERSPDVGAAFLYGSGLVMIGVWVLSTTMGAAVGNALPGLERYGIGFAFTAAFIAMTYGLWQRKSQLLPWLTAAVFALGTCSIGISSAFGILAGAFAGLVAIYLQKVLQEEHP